MVWQHLAVREGFQERQYIFGVAGVHRQTQRRLQKRLNDEEKEIFEKFTECTNEMYGIAEREAFVRGFTLGARIIIEIMNTEIE